MQHEPSVVMFRWQIMAIAVRTPDRVASVCTHATYEEEQRLEDAIGARSGDALLL